MEYRRLGTSDLNVSAVCLGTMTFGQQNTEAEAHAQLDYAVSRGINFIDTAEMYPVPPRAETCTRTETIVGSWLKKQPRDKIILGTKVAGPSRGVEWIRGGPKSLDRANIRAAIEGSLQRLQTDYIDLYQLHWPERNVPIFGQYQFDPAREKESVTIREQLETLAELVKEGKVSPVGVSNEQPWGVMEFLAIGAGTRPAAHHLHPELLQPHQPQLRVRHGGNRLPRESRPAGLLPARFRPSVREISGRSASRRPRHPVQGLRLALRQAQRRRASRCRAGRKARLLSRCVGAVLRHASLVRRQHHRRRDQPGAVAGESGCLGKNRCQKRCRRKLKCCICAT